MGLAAYLHIGWQGTSCVGLGFMKCIDEESENRFTIAKYNIEVGGRTYYYHSEFTTSVTVTWSYQTSEDPNTAGPMSDVFVVPNLNLVYTPVLYLNYDTSTCQVKCADGTSGYDCQLPNTMIIHFENPDSKPALAFYSRSHIINVKLKEIELGLKSAKNIYDQFSAKTDTINGKSNIAKIDGVVYIFKDVKKNIAVLEAGMSGWNDTLKKEKSIYDLAIANQNTITSWDNGNSFLAPKQLYLKGNELKSFQEIKASSKKKKNRNRFNKNFYFTIQWWWKYTFYSFIQRNYGS